MKFIVLLSLTFFSLSSFACIEINKDFKICNTDQVYKTNDRFSYAEAEVTKVNETDGSILITTNNLEHKYTLHPSDIDLTYGCVENICVNNKVFQGGKFKKGAIVVAVNPIKGTVFLKTIDHGYFFPELPKNLEIAKGCLEGICVGEYYESEELEKGGKIVGVNPHNRSFNVKSLKTGYFKVFFLK